MITCNKCGYDKAVQGLNEIWCDKCDANAVTPVQYIDEKSHPCQIAPWDWQLPDGRIMSGTGFVYPTTYYSNALPSQPFDDNQHAEHIRLHQNLFIEKMREDAARTFAGRRDPWLRADDYFAKEDICRFVNDFFHEKIPDFWLNLSHGDHDMWSAVLCADGNPVVSYYNKNLQSLCHILEKAFDERPDTPGDGIMLIVRTAIENYFSED